MPSKFKIQNTKAQEVFGATHAARLGHQDSGHWDMSGIWGLRLEIWL
jgi:hypothetical protein